MTQFNLLFLMPNKAFGGLEIQTVRRAFDAQKMGHNVILLAKEKSRVEKYAKQLKIEVLNLEIKHRYIDKVAFTLGKVMKQNKIHACIVPKTDYLSYAILGRNLFSKSTKVVFYQQLESAFPKKDFFHNWIYRNVDLVITLTNVMKTDFPKYTNIDINKIEVIPYGINTDLYNPEKHNKLRNREKLKLPTDKFLLGLPGRIADSKGQDVAIKAFAKANISNSNLVLCGDGSQGSFYAMIMNMAENLGIKDKIIHLPFTDYIPNFMNSMDISLLPSKREAFGLVVIEAMASGLSVIATNAGGVPEIITHEKNGLLFDPYDDETLANYMALLAINDELRNKLGRKARKDILEKYKYETQTKKFFNSIENIINENI